MRFLIVLFVFGFLAAMLVHASENTLIIMNATTSECRVLEAPSLEELPGVIPAGWQVVSLTPGQCEKAIVALKDNKGLDSNIQSYVSLLSCSNPNHVKSLSYFGVGGREVCAAAGLDYRDGRLVVSLEPLPKKSSPLTLTYGIVFIAVIILILLFLILVKRKRRIM